MVHDPDQYSTDLMKCIYALDERDAAEGTQVRAYALVGGSAPSLTGNDARMTIE